MKKLINVCMCLAMVVIPVDFSNAQCSVGFGSGNGILGVRGAIRQNVQNRVNRRAARRSQRVAMRFSRVSYRQTNRGYQSQSYGSQGSQSYGSQGSTSYGSQGSTSYGSQGGQAYQSYQPVYRQSSQGNDGCFYINGRKVCPLNTSINTKNIEQNDLNEDLSKQIAKKAPMIKGSNSIYKLPLEKEDALVVSKKAPVVDNILAAAQLNVAKL